MKDELGEESVGRCPPGFDSSQHLWRFPVLQGSRQKLCGELDTISVLRGERNRLMKDRKEKKQVCTF